MGLLSSIGNFLKPIATAALKAAAPIAGDAVKSLLGKVVGDGFDAVKSFGQGLVSQLPFIGGIASKYLGKGVDALKGLTNGAISKFIDGLVQKVAPQNVDGKQVTVPTVSTGNRNVAGIDIPAIQAQLPAAVAAAATAAPKASAPAGGTGSSIDIATKALAAAKGNNSKEQALLDTIEDPKQKAMMQAQFDLAHLQEQTQFISTVAKMMHETSNTVIRNIA
jgi:hypothetical protein